MDSAAAEAEGGTVAPQQHIIVKRCLLSLAELNYLLEMAPEGNPGHSPFYLPFAKALYSLMKSRFPVWIISHAGFSVTPKNKKILTAPQESNAQRIEDVYGLNGQIEHKIAFLRTHVPKDVKLILIGHSVGSYIALHVLNRAPDLPVVHTFLLFPTIERMSTSPNGNFKSELPLTDVLQPFCLALTFYYGKTDGWCPIKYYEDMKKDFPEGNIYLCEKGLPHAFVLGFYQEMANTVADWISRLPRK
ncbi:Lipid droplet-associated hydrolase [Apodemus speciosus]|uniref:Lipid droplet-associated hydrolase n=1 Tax=Apodemus speciosus TaxID=105296 RepID=A0ABQ0FDQ9_APOSI